MVSVYLDQNKWIDIARAMHGRADGEQYRIALDVAQQSVSMGLVRFPLSMAHYIETWRQSDAARRGRLAQTMLAISRGSALARPPDLCDNELDALLARIGDTTLPREPWPPLGFGFGHAAGLTHKLTETDIDQQIELQHLSQRPDEFLNYGRGHKEFGERYRAGEQQLAKGSEERDEGKDMHEAVIATSAVMEIHENIGWALDRAQIPADALGPIGRVRPDLPEEQVHATVNEALPVARAFIAELPTRDAALRLRLLRHQDRSLRWKPNDLNDIAYLACAVVHCDVVVTEKQWVHELGRSGLLADHGTRAMHDVSELPAVLAEIVR